MIALSPTRGLLDRFVSDLDRTAPRQLPRRDMIVGIDRHERTAARFAWATRVVDEYRSVVVFTELLTHLGTIEAPYAALAAVHRLIGDELRHARMCAEVSGWFGPFDEVEIDLSDLALPATDDAPEVRALEIVARELVVAESESIRVLRRYRDATDDAGCRAALQILLTDEARHAATGRVLLDVLVAHCEPDTVAELLAELPFVMAEDRADIVAAHAEVAVGGPGRRYGASIRKDEAPTLEIAIR